MTENEARLEKVRDLLNQIVDLINQGEVFYINEEFYVRKPTNNKDGVAFEDDCSDKYIFYDKNAR